MIYLCHTLRLQVDRHTDRHDNDVGKVLLKLRADRDTAMRQNREGGRKEGERS